MRLSDFQGAKGGVGLGVDKRNVCPENVRVFPSQSIVNHCRVALAWLPRKSLLKTYLPCSIIMDIVLFFHKLYPHLPSKRIHQRAYHLKSLRGGHAAETVTPAEWFHREKCKTACDNSRDSALYTAFGFPAHSLLSAPFERICKYYLQKQRDYSRAPSGKNNRNSI